MNDIATVKSVKPVGSKSPAFLVFRNQFREILIAETISGEHRLPGTIISGVITGVKIAEEIERLLGVKIKQMTLAHIATTPDCSHYFNAVEWDGNIHCGAYSKLYWVGLGNLPEDLDVQSREVLYTMFRQGMEVSTKIRVSPSHRA